MPYAHAETLGGALRAATHRHEVEHPLPIHGRPISGADVPAYLERCGARLERLTSADTPS